MKVIVYTNENGNVSVCTPTGELSIEEVLVKDCPDGAIIIDSDVLPQDNDFFNAWELVSGSVLVNIGRAKEVTKERLRIEREPLLKNLDVQFMRTLEAGEDTSAIVAEKQRLRDITKLADTATTLEELKALEAK